jgi:hypothetical protein
MLNEHMSLFSFIFREMKLFFLRIVCIGIGIKYVSFWCVGMAHVVASGFVAGVTR